jgi:hypothetical protein
MECHMDVIGTEPVEGKPFFYRAEFSSRELAEEELVRIAATTGAAFVENGKCGFRCQVAPPGLSVAAAVVHSFASEAAAPAAADVLACDLTQRAASERGQRTHSKATAFACLAYATINPVEGGGHLLQVCSVHTDHGTGPEGTLRKEDGVALRVANMSSLVQKVLEDCNGDKHAAWALFQQRRPAVVRMDVFMRMAEKVLAAPRLRALWAVQDWGDHEAFLRWASMFPQKFAESVVAFKNTGHCCYVWTATGLVEMPESSSYRLYSHEAGLRLLARAKVGASDMAFKIVHGDKEGCILLFTVIDPDIGKAVPIAGATCNSKHAIFITVCLALLRRAALDLTGRTNLALELWMHDCVHAGDFFYSAAACQRRACLLHLTPLPPPLFPPKKCFR